MSDNNPALSCESVLIAVSCRYRRAAKKLLPREALAQFALIESRAHATVEGNTFPFLKGLGHFLPNEQGIFCAGCPHQAACRAWHRAETRQWESMAA